MSFITALRVFALKDRVSLELCVYVCECIRECMSLPEWVYECVFVGVRAG